MACAEQVNMRTGAVDSEANVTDIHEALHFDVMDNEGASDYHHSFGIWSLRWGADGREVVAGTGDHSLYVYNMERQKVDFLHLCVSENCTGNAQIVKGLLVMTPSLCQQHGAAKGGFPAYIDGSYAVWGTVVHKWHMHGEC